MMRERIRVRGQVQGVGFRPFVYRLAGEAGLNGWVRNDSHGVLLEVQGDPAVIGKLAERLFSEAPPLARIDHLERCPVPLQGEQGGFTIHESERGAADTAVTPDAATCPACLAELFDPADRRYQYPFTNCTHCGPRYTITRAIPYDRSNTTMAAFPLCETCGREYRDPLDRRFHAQPNACPVCGPSLELYDAAGCRQNGDPIAATLARLKRGDVVAIKGLGGFHLACNARDREAVARLRCRKGREAKPLAVMAANAESLAGCVEWTEAEKALLTGSERPIVLLRKRSNTDSELAGCAPGVGWLGAMLPCTPIHYLLFHEAAGRPVDGAWLQAPWELLLVMTSANPGGEPLVIDNDEALRRLSGIADAWLMHDRPIAVRCDDSVMRVDAGGPAFIRRARGFTPQAISLPHTGPSTLAVGGYFKNTVCLTRGSEAFVSQHIGQLDSPANRDFLAEVVDHLCDVLRIRPEQVVHDRHDDLPGSQWAADYINRTGVKRVEVQHHHAHIAAVAAEHGVADRPLLGLALDGVGAGDDGTAWGGELLRVEAGGYRRFGHLSTLPLPGGDRAAREPWRMGAAVLHRLGRGEAIPARFEASAAGPIAEMLQRDVNCPETSSMGRWFDAAAGLLGVCPVMNYEGEAPMLLEGLAERHGAVAPLSDGFRLESGTLDLLPLLAELADIGDAGFGAALFHATLAEGLAAWAAAAADAEGIAEIVFGGGCFLNRTLSTGLRERLSDTGLRVLEARRLPPNDGGLSLGQAWVAIQQATVKERSDAGDRRT
ncbi:hydrogenase maturation protein HypF [Thiohalomonas denitrificans]|uniref:Carbamoyltransferase HypF n=2 Tax=Thiohalomonas denitrificans TaxID=415747 RepID=A0A1G5QIR5_9GAMM|nr:hydrogenase maturation protein HypF [Thiohalomonas denitrificans]